MSRYDPQPQTVPISGIWLRRIGDDLEVLAEIDEEWRVVITEKQDGYMSHIVEVGGILGAISDSAAKDPR